MSIDKNKLIRYRVYDRCFSNFTNMYTRSVLCNNVNEALCAAGNSKEGGQSIRKTILFALFLVQFKKSSNFAP